MLKRNVYKEFFTFNMDTFVTGLTNMKNPPHMENSVIPFS